jgi:hypothetical protein
VSDGLAGDPLLRALTEEHVQRSSTVPPQCQASW